jgi:cytochrome c
MRRSIRFSLTAAPMLLVLGACLNPPVSAAGPDAGSGKDVFERRCSGCHAADTSKEGPPLRGVVGRKAGTAASFQYSDALRASGITWNEALLRKWLENPDAMVKGTDMEFRVAKPEERDAVVAYLKSLTK